MAEPPLKFQFGAKGNVRAEETYDATRGYGFEPTEGDAPWTRFSVRVPEGNYRVTVRLGASDRPSLTSVAAETRRLMLENVATRPGKFVERTSAPISTSRGTSSQATAPIRTRCERSREQSRWR